MTVQEKRIVFPELERYSDFPLYNTKAVVQQTGIPAPTLRAWERRYEFLSPGRTNHAYRRYSQRDIAIILWLKERVDEGMSISQAIALFRHLDEERMQSGKPQGGVVPPVSTPSFQVTLPTSSENNQAQAPIESVTEVQTSRESATSLQNMPHITVEKTLEAYPAIYDMGMAKERLLEAFETLDEPAAEILMASMLAIYSIEQVCAELIAPTLWEIGQLWEQEKITVSVEHFASAYFHGLLANLLHVTPEVGSGPLVILCCAPGEAHELAPLMLALLLRRAGMHIVYLGQSIETAGLLDTIRQMAPALVCVSLTLPNFLEALIDLGHKVQKLPPPQPKFAFGGKAFEQHKDFISQVPGFYFAGNLHSIVAQLQHLAMEQTS